MRSSQGWRQVRRAIEGLASLGEDWDGLGARAPSLGMVWAAVELAGWLGGTGCDLPGSVTATPAGTILFDWQGEATDFELEVVSPARVEWMTMDREGRARHGCVAMESINALPTGG